MQEVWLSLDAIFGIIGLVVGFVLHKWFTERKIGDAQSRAEALVQDAARDAETRRKTAELEAKETALKARTIFEDETRRRERETADVKAKEVLATTIQRLAPDYTVETAVAVVDLPSDDMKGRIIGREGRNIRALELHTGVDLIVDDTPEAVLISSYDPYRREIARQA